MMRAAASGLLVLLCVGPALAQAGTPMPKPAERPPAERPPAAPPASADSARPAANEEAKRANNIRELGGLIQRCWKVPDGSRSIASDATIRFSLRADGTVFGQPIVTYAHRGLSEREREVYTRSLNEAIVRCAPFAITDKFGAALAGKPIAVRFRIP